MKRAWHSNGRVDQALIQHLTKSMLDVRMPDGLADEDAMWTAWKES